VLARSEYERARRLIAETAAERWFQDALFDPETPEEFNRAYKGRERHPYIYLSPRARPPQPGGVQVSMDGVWLIFEPRPLPIGVVVRGNLRPVGAAKVAFVVALAATSGRTSSRPSAQAVDGVRDPSVYARSGSLADDELDRRGPSGDTLNDRVEPLVHEAPHTGYGCSARARLIRASVRSRARADHAAGQPEPT
jgi:hypothetical protein